MTFDTEMYIFDIMELPYFDRFSDVVVRDTESPIPKCVTHLTFTFGFNKKIGSCLPATVTRLTFSNNFNQLIKGAVPKSVTHLTFGHCYRSPVIDYIPESVTHLKFGAMFDRPEQNTSIYRKYNAAQNLQTTH